MAQTRQVVPFSVGVTPDTQGVDVGLHLLVEAGVATGDVLMEGGRFTAAQLSSHQAFVVRGQARATAEAIEAADPTPMLLARVGIGADQIDLDACTRQGVIVSITPDGAARPLAVAALTHILASTLNLHAKDQMVRTGEWNRERNRWLGRGLVGKTVGLIGLGNVGRILAGLLVPLQPHVIACDPYIDPAEAAKLGVELVSLDDLLTRSDVVVVVAPLTPETRHMIGAAQFARMKPTVSFVNVARGPIVDHAALVDALQRGVIANAGLDVFEQEPLPADDPITKMNNVSLSPHGLCITDEWAIGCGGSAVRAILAVRAGNVPQFVANRAVLEHPGLQARLKALRDG